MPLHKQDRKPRKGKAKKMALTPAAPAPAAPAEKPATMSVEAAAKRLNIGRNQAYNACAADPQQIPAIRIGKRWLVITAAIDRMLGEVAG
jgi:hypothetical protein